MPRGLGRLSFLTRRSTSSDRGASEQPTLVAGSVDPDAAPVGPPVLLPATIIRQVLFDASELTPVWARPRPDPGAVPVPAEATARKRTRRASTAGAAKAGPTKATSRSIPRSNRSPKGGG